MTPIVVIHARKGSYSDKWIELCEERGLEHRIIQGLKPGVMNAIRGGDLLLWHLNHREPRELLVGPSILTAAERMGLVTYPDDPTRLPFEDKIAQKYLFEALDLPLVPTEVFLRKEDALLWVQRASWPKVFKLRRGSGSQMVKLLKTPQEAHKLVEQAFGQGFLPVEKPLGDAGVKARKFKTNPVEFVKKVPGGLKKIRKQKQLGLPEKGYFYVQEFLPDNDHDTRITVIGDRIFAYRRLVRPGDWRASGGGRVDWNPEEIDPRCLEVGRDIARKLSMQSVAMDLVFDKENNPRLLEASYVFISHLVHSCPGHWDMDLNWHEGQVWPEEAILDDVIFRTKESKESEKRN